MNHVRDDFLAHTTFSYDEHVGVRRRHRIYQFFDLLHHLAFENRREPCLSDFQALLELLGFFPKFFRLLYERLFFQGFLDQTEQFFRRVWFADEMVGTALDRFDCIVQ